MSKKLKLFVLSSVMLNVLLVGVIFGHVARRGLPQMGWHHGPTIRGELPPEKEALFFQSMRELREQSAKINTAIRKTRAEVFEILTAPVFDADLYQQKVDGLHHLHGERVKLLSHATKKLAAQFTQQERVVLAEHLKRRVRSSAPHPEKRSLGTYAQ